jgi:PKHD-type hydroxylase
MIDLTGPVCSQPFHDESDQGFRTGLAPLVMHNFLMPSEANYLSDYAVQKGNRITVPHDGDDEYRNANIHFLRDEGFKAFAPILGRVFALMEFGAKFYGYTVEGIPKTSFQLSNYETGGNYNWHHDVTGSGHYRRLVTVVVELSDPRTYEGGGFEYKHVYGGNTHVVKPPLGIGSAIVMASNTQHRALTVTAGTRQTLVAWGVGLLNKNRSYVAPHTHVPSLNAL